MNYTNKIKLLGSDMEMAVITLTPEVAKEFLRNNSTCQRNIKKTLVERITNDLLEGRWKTGTGEALKFNSQGIMIDGQHRCLAVINANVSIEMLCMFNCEDDIINVLDTGVKRTVADVLKIHGYKNCRNLAALVAAYIRYKAAIVNGRFGGRPISAMEILNFLKKNPDIAKTRTLAANKLTKNGISNSCFSLCYYITAKYSPEMAEACYKYATNAAISSSQSNAMAVYRDYCLRLKAGRGCVQIAYVLPITIRSFNAYWSGADVRKLVSHPNSRFPRLLCEIENCGI